MNRLAYLWRAGAACLLAACGTPENQLETPEDLTKPIAEQETGRPYIPSPLSVSAMGRVEAAPDIAVVTGLIEIEDKTYDAAYAQVADIINGIQATADTADTEMSYTDISAVNKWDEDCLEDNRKAQTRYAENLTAQRHNKSVRRQMKFLTEQNENAQESYQTERLKRLATIRKLRANRDIPEFRRELLEKEEGLEDFDTQFEQAQKQRDERQEQLEESVKKVEPRLSQKTCGVLSIKANLRFTARINPAEKAPEFMNAFTQAGAEEVNLYGYDFSDYDAVYQKAAEQAVANARKKAELIAQRSGSRLKKVQTFSISQPTRFGRFGPQSKAVVSQPRYANSISIPPEFETVTETVVVQEASAEYVTLPPTYETITETVVVQPQSVEYVVVPATYKTVMETLVVQEGYEYNGQIVPPVTQQVSRRVIDTPSRTVEKSIPAVTKQVTRRVVKTPASTMERVIPAVTKEVSRRVIKTPAMTVMQPKTTEQTDVASNKQSNALRQSVLSGPQKVEVSAYMVFDYATALEGVRIRN